MLFVSGVATLQNYTDKLELIPFSILVDQQSKAIYIYIYI